MAMPQSYESLMSSYKQNQLAQLPEAQRMLSAQQMGRGTFTSPISNFGLSNLYNKYLTNLGQKEAELGLSAAQAGQQESQFSRNLGQNESQFVRNMQFQKDTALEEYMRNLKLAKLGAKPNWLKTGLGLGMIGASFIPGVGLPAQAALTTGGSKMF